MSRQDRQGARTPADLEQKYKFGKSFAEVMGIALDAQKSVEEADAALKAELSLKLGYDENDKVISMINAASDVICLRSNRLIIESDKFSLDEDGTVSMRFSEEGAPDEYLLNTATHYLKLPDFEVRRHKSSGTYVSIRDAKIGTARFSTKDIHITPQVEFTDNGVLMWAWANPSNSNSCLVWQDEDGNRLFQLRGGANGLHLEGLEADFLDLIVSEISLRDIYERLIAVEQAVNVSPPEECEHDYTRVEQKEGCAVYYEYTCEKCGDTYTTDTVRYEHEFFEGQCTSCGETDPDYTDPFDHDHVYSDFNEIGEGVCSVCGEACLHTNTTYHEDDGYYTCNDCGFEWG